MIKASLWKSPLTWMGYSEWGEGEGWKEMIEEERLTNREVPSLPIFCLALVDVLALKGILGLMQME